MTLGFSDRQESYARTGRTQLTGPQRRRLKHKLNHALAAPARRERRAAQAAASAARRGERRMLQILGRKGDA